MNEVLSKIESLRNALDQIKREINEESEKNQNIIMYLNSKIDDAYWQLNEIQDITENIWNILNPKYEIKLIRIIDNFAVGSILIDNNEYVMAATRESNFTEWQILKKIEASHVTDIEKYTENSAIICTTTDVYIIYFNYDKSWEMYRISDTHAIWSMCTYNTNNKKFIWFGDDTLKFSPDLNYDGRVIYNTEEIEYAKNLFTYTNDFLEVVVRDTDNPCFLVLKRIYPVTGENYIGNKVEIIDRFNIDGHPITRIFRDKNTYYAITEANTLYSFQISCGTILRRHQYNLGSIYPIEICCFDVNTLHFHTNIGKIDSNVSVINIRTDREILQINVMEGIFSVGHTIKYSSDDIIAYDCNRIYQFPKNGEGKCIQLYPETKTLGNINLINKA